MKIELQQAIAIHQSGDLEKAESLYLNLLQLEPENSDTLHLLSILSAQKKHFSQALIYIEQAIQQAPNVSSFYNSLGNIYKNQKRWNKAIEAYYQALALNPTSAQILSNLGNLLYSQGKWEEAIEHYQSALKLNPNSPDTLCNLGISFNKLGDSLNAKNAFQKATQIEPLHSIAQLELGKIAHLEKNSEQAFFHYQRCLEIDPTEIEALNNLGALFLAQNKLEDAIEILSKAVTYHPKHVESLTNLGNAYLKNQALNEALSCYLRLIQINPEFDTYYNLGVIYMYKDHHQSAIDYFHQALILKEKDLNTQINLGSIYLKLENHKKAIEHYEMALREAPDHVEVQYLLAALKQQQDHAFQSAPNAYIQSLFDQYAPYFDIHLNQYLHYQTPKALFKAVSEYREITQAKWNVLDLGCGTGLCGPLFKPLAKMLTGIDLSSKMIEMAEKKKCYDTLKVQSIEEALPCFQEIDLILAADVLTYIGELRTLFTLVWHSLKFGGLFAFTTEKTFLNQYVLQPSARFAHHPEYIKNLTLQTGFEMAVCENTLLREQNKTPLEGQLWILKK